jgi:hypothetical protein
MSLENWVKNSWLEKRDSGRRGARPLFARSFRPRFNAILSSWSGR